MTQTGCQIRNGCHRNATFRVSPFWVKVRPHTIGRYDKSFRKVSKAEPEGIPVRFRVIDVDDSPKAITRFPTAVLRRSRWDDFGYRTSFELTVHLSESEVASIGDVKIVMKGQSSGATPLPENGFAKLNEEYCSLGQAFSYYEALLRLGERIYRPILDGLRDVTVDAVRLAGFEDEHPFKFSLLRVSGAELALRDAPALFRGQPSSSAAPGNLKFSFKTRVGGSPFVVKFDFGGAPEIPGRICAVIGYNGTGKTTLLANLAMVAYHAGLSNTPRIRKQYGRIVEQDLRFGAVIAISYSALDTFDLPGRNALERERISERGDLFGYVYCGLRTYQVQDVEQADASLRLKAIDEIRQEFTTAVERATGKKRRELFIRAMTPLAHEPSFNRIGIGQLLTGEPESLEQYFDNMSTGHKMVVNIVAQLVAHLEKRSIVLFDEPESHLHPPLLAALLKSMRIVLDDRDSFAIIATHSPVVLQETPKRCVLVLRRFDHKTEVAKPENETFGENIGLLTREAFSLNSSSTDFHDVLETLARTHTMLEMEELFGSPLSSQARAFVLSLKRGAD